ncbi:MAG: ABC transporter substrate-binding protein [Actinomycetota bacterium]|nr:ABC transporter substrate-binding protein [Acidimicrobiales bacterium]
MKQLVRVAVFAIVSILMFSSCGGQESITADEATADTQAPVIEEPSDDNKLVTLEADEEVPEGPQSIVSLSPTATEMLFAIGAGSQVVAVDNYSYYPKEAPVIEDLSAWSPNIEAIAEFEPDLVVLSDAGVQEELESLGIEVLVLPAVTNLGGVYEQIAELGVATANVDGAGVLVASMRAEISLIIDNIVTPEKPLTYFHELDDTLYSITSGTFIGQIYEMVGLSNIADPADADGSAYGYPQLTQEFILESDPDLIFFVDASCCGQSVEIIGERPGWDVLKAVRNGTVIEMDADIASRWGPRLVQFLQSLSDAVALVPAG